MKRFREKRKMVSLTLVGVAYLLIVIPLIVSNVQKQQDVRSNADTTTAQSQVCGAAPSNTMLVIDRSGSMGKKERKTTKIAKGINDGDNFVDLKAKNVQNELGLVSFATTATTDSSLTTNVQNVKTPINALKASGSTCIQCGIDAANKAI